MARIKVRKMVRLPERTHEVTGEWPNECAIEKNERTKNDRSNERMGEWANRPSAKLEDLVFI